MNQTKLTNISRKSKSALKRPSLIDRLKLKDLEQSKTILVISAGAFILHWLANVVASLMFLHFQPETGELGLLISLLLTSLFTFIIAIVSFIELLKFSYAGRSIAVALAWANFFLHILLLIYTHYWLGACIHLVFALAITVLLTGKTSLVKFALSILLLIVNFTLILYPATKYMQTRNFVEDKMSVINEFNPNSDAKIENITKIVANTKLLHNLAPYFGEKEKYIALYTGYFALAKAYEGSITEGYQHARASVRTMYVEQCYINKTKVYAMLKQVKYEDYKPKILTNAENELIEKKMSMLKFSEDIGEKNDDGLSDLDDDFDDDNEFSGFDN